MTAEEKQIEDRAAEALRELAALMSRAHIARVHVMVKDVGTLTVERESTAARAREVRAWWLEQ